MTHLTHETRADLRTRIQQGLDIAMHKEDVAFWQAMLLAVEDAELADAALARVKELEKDGFIWVSTIGWAKSLKERDRALAVEDAAREYVRVHSLNANIEEIEEQIRLAPTVWKKLCSALLAEGSDR
jgi:hypothetical protein